MDLFFGGAEQPAWVTLLHDNGVRYMSLSFLSLRRRVKRLDRWRLSDKFPEDVVVYLDSGAFTLNKSGSQTTAAEAEELESEYRRFVEANIHRLEFASEFDANVLGHEAIFANREEFWNRLPDRKWMPVWHADYGTSNLIALGDEYGRLGILQDDAGGDLTVALNRMAGRVRLHGVGMTQMDMMRAVRWDSVGSTRWLAPTQWGETFVWTNHNELKDYPKKNQEQGRKRHRTWLAEQGFDTEAIEAGDSKELLRLSIWSWQKFAGHLNEVTTWDDPPAAGNPEPDRDGATISPPARGNEELPPAPAEVVPRAGRTLLPVVGFDYATVSELGENGQPAERQEARFVTPSVTLLRCNTCFMKDKCPAMQPGNDCAYDIPVQLRTPAQLDALQSSLIEMQTQRVLFMRMIEQTEGGYADPNLSTEIERLRRMLNDRAEGKNTFKLTVEASGSAPSAGMISRIFGNDAGERLAAIEAPADTQSVIADAWEAEVIE